MKFGAWQNIVLAWINTLNLNKNPIDDLPQLKTGLFLGKILAYIGGSKYKDEGKCQLELVENFLQVEYPEYRLPGEWSDDDLTLVASLLLARLSLKHDDPSLHAPLFQLNYTTQCIIRSYLQGFMTLPAKSITPLLVQQTILNIDVEESIIEDNMDLTPSATSPLQCCYQSPITSKKTAATEIRSLKNELVLLKGENSFLHDELDSFKVDMEHLRVELKKKEQENLKLGNELFLKEAECDCRAEERSTCRVEGVPPESRDSAPPSGNTCYTSHDVSTLYDQLAAVTDDYKAKLKKSEEVCEKWRLEAEDFSTKYKMSLDKIMTLEKTIKQLEATCQEQNEILKDQMDEIATDKQPEKGKRRRTLSLGANSVAVEFAQVEELSANHKEMAYKVSLMETLLTERDETIRQQREDIDKLRIRASELDSRNSAPLEMIHWAVQAVNQLTFDIKSLYENPSMYMDTEGDSNMKKEISEGDTRKLADVLDTMRKQIIKAKQALGRTEVTKHELGVQVSEGSTADEVKALELQLKKTIKKLDKAHCETKEKEMKISELLEELTEKKKEISSLLAEQDKANELKSKVKQLSNEQSPSKALETELTKMGEQLEREKEKVEQIQTRLEKTSVELLLKTENLQEERGMAKRLQDKLDQMVTALTEKDIVEKELRKKISFKYEKEKEELSRAMKKLETEIEEQKNELDRLLLEDDEKSEKTKEMKAKIDELTAQLGQMDWVERRLREKLIWTTSNDREKTVIVRQLTLKVNELRDELENKQKKINELEVMLPERELALDNNSADERKLSELKEELVKKTEEASALKLRVSQLKDKGEEVENLAAKVERLEQENAEKAQLIIDLRGHMDELITEVSNKMETVETLRSRLYGMDSQRQAELESIVAGSSGQGLGWRTGKKKMKMEIERLERELLARGQRVRTLESKADYLEGKAAAAEVRLKNITDNSHLKVDELQQAIEKLNKSIGLEFEEEVEELRRRLMNREVVIEELKEELHKEKRCRERRLRGDGRQSEQSSYREDRDTIDKVLKRKLDKMDPEVCGEIASLLENLEEELRRKEDECEKRLAEASAKGEEVKVLATKIDWLENSLQEAATLTREKDSELRALEACLNRVSRAIPLTQDLSKEFEADIRSMTSELENKEVLLARLTSELERLQTENFLASGDSKITLDGKLSEKGFMVQLVTSQMEEVKKEKEERVEKLMRKVRLLLFEVGAKGQELVDKEEACRSLRQELVDKEEACRSLRQELEECRTLLASREEELASLSKQLHDTTTLYSQTEEKVELLNKEAKRLKLEVEEVGRRAEKELCSLREEERRKTEEVRGLEDKIQLLTQELCLREQLTNDVVQKVAFMTVQESGRREKIEELEMEVNKLSEEVVEKNTKLEELEARLRQSRVEREKEVEALNSRLRSLCLDLSIKEELLTTLKEKVQNCMVNGYKGLVLDHSPTSSDHSSNAKKTKFLDWFSPRKPQEGQKSEELPPQLLNNAATRKTDENNLNKEGDTNMCTPIIKPEPEFIVELLGMLEKYSCKLEKYKQKVVKDQWHLEELSCRLWEMSDNFLASQQELNDCREQLSRVKLQNEAILNNIALQGVLAPQVQRPRLTPEELKGRAGFENFGLDDSLFEQSVMDYCLKNNDRLSCQFERRRKHYSLRSGKVHPSFKRESDVFSEDKANVTQGHEIFKDNQFPDLKDFFDTGAKKSEENFEKNLSKSLEDLKVQERTALLPTTQKPRKQKYHITYRKPGPPTPCKNYGRFSLQGGDLPMHKPLSKEKTSTLKRLFKFKDTEPKKSVFSLGKQAGSKQSNRENQPP